MISGLLGGALIGVAATLLWVGTGRVAGVSGILRGALFNNGERRGELIAFLLGLIVVGAAAGVFGATPRPTSQPLGLLACAGLLVGFGTRLGGGCTSGHGVCGVSRFAPRSLVATATFVATGAATVLVTRHLLPALVAP